jgi:O-antigen/teichoic acid export membrane protein
VTSHNIIDDAFPADPPRKSGYADRVRPGPLEATGTTAQYADRYDYWVDDTLTLPLPVVDGRPVVPGRLPQTAPRHASDSGARNPVAGVFSALRDPAYRGSYALVANTLGTNVIGAIYWVVAARLYGPEALGRAAALISGLMLVALLSQLNLSSTLMRFLPQMGAASAGRLIRWSYLATSFTALAGSVIFVTVLPRLSSEWHFVGGSPFLAVLFAVSVIVWEIFTLQDGALVGLQHAVAVPIENVIYSLAKLVLLVVAAKLLGSTDILFSWMIPLILLIPVMNWLILRYLKDRSPYDMVPGMRIRHLARFASVDYLGVICGQVTATVLPLLVISVLGPVAAGSFYIASLITTGAASVGISFSSGLLVEASAAPDRLPTLTRGALKRCIMIMGPATIVLVLGAHFILRVYGGSYSVHTLVLFQLLALTLVPYGIVSIAFSLDRVARKPIRSTLSEAAIAVLTLGGSWLLFARLGLNAVGVASFGAAIVVALVRLPTVLAVLRQRPGTVARPAGASQQASVPDSRAPARLRRPSNGRSYAGRHRHDIIAEKLRPESGDVKAASSHQGRYQAVSGNLQVKEVQIDDADDGFVICNPDDPGSASFGAQGHGRGPS